MSSVDRPVPGLHTFLLHAMSEVVDAWATGEVEPGTTVPAAPGTGGAAVVAAAARSQEGR